MAMMTRSEQRAARGQRTAGKSEPSTRKGRSKDRDKDRTSAPDGAGKDSRRKGRGGDKPAEALVPTLPTVNLLPPAVIERAQVERLRRRFGLAAGAAVAAVAAAYVLQSGAISTANDELAAEQARTSMLTARVTALGPVKVYYAAVDANAATIQQTMAREVLVSDVVERLYSTAPDGVGLDTVDITVDTQPVPAEALAAGTAAAGEPAAAAPLPTTSGACPSPDPYLAPGATAGCIAITGSAVSREELGRWEAGLGRTDLFADLFISDSQAAGEGADAITFTASVSITAKAYSDRYADQAFLQEATR